MTIRHNRLNKQNVIVAKLWQNDGKKFRKRNGQKSRFEKTAFMR